MRVHLLGVPNTQTTRAYYLDGFAMMTLRFAEVLQRLGHEVWLYGAEANEAPCARFISVLTAAEQAAFIGETPYQTVPFDVGTPLFLTFNSRAAAYLQSHKQPGDVLATICGSAQMPVWNQNPDLRFLEYSIGYRGACAPYRVYQSHVWRHVVHGFTGLDGGRECDAVIPPFYDVAEFPCGTDPDDYVIYCGRVVPRKGLATVCAAAQAAGVRLVVIGPGDPSILTYGEYMGTPPPEERNRLLAGAKALLMPTQYIEPFGNVSAEAQLCGTPVISTDYGAFVETVDHGRTGFRCTYLGEYVQAIQQADQLDRPAIRDRAVRLWSLETAVAAYRKYFHRLDLEHGEGWPSLAPAVDPVFQGVYA